MIKKFPTKSLLLTLVIFLLSNSIQSQDTYQTPPKEILDILEAELAPITSISPDGETIALLKRRDFPPISDLAQPELKIAGLRINPRTFSRSRTGYYTGISFLNVKSGIESNVSGLPDNMRISNLEWSPDSKKIAFTLEEYDGLYAWYIDLSTSTAKLISSRKVNDILGSAIEWYPDSKSVMLSLVQGWRGLPPVKDEVPTGPVIQENIGKVAPSRTYQDLLTNEHDIELFEHYCNTDLIRIDLAGTEHPTSLSGIFKKNEFSPDGKYLLIEQIKTPYSYLVPWYFFPFDVFITDITGMPIKQLASVPLGEDIPVAFGSVIKGPRRFDWRQDKPATVFWLVAQDDGDASKDAEVRDKLFELSEPFTGEPGELVTFVNRFSGIMWGNDNIAIATDFRWQTRNVKVYQLNPENGTQKIIIDRSSEDRYNDPGSPVMQQNSNGTSTLLFTGNGSSIYLSGLGASPEGNRPFLDVYNLESGNVERLFRSEAPYYERVLSLTSTGFITSKESEFTPPNIHFRSFTGEEKALTNFENPYPQLEDVSRELIQYKREDGINLTATLYLPPGYEPGDSLLPVLMWAYPQEFVSSDAAGQVRDSPYRFSRVFSGSPIFWVLRGFAVLDNPTMPVVGEEPNNTFIEQLVSSASAAIEELVRRGIADRERIAIGGHSYGAFMTANLLAHSDLFAAGIARSGAYNRTLTPFGFQSEQRTLWQAPEVYMTMSPFMYADKINEPILFIHGEVDNNAGTFPMQSERMYNAVKGHGGITRLVILPYESHGYASKESIYHTLWETDTWLETWVKNKNRK